jgi:3-deoxy-D-manno-octulosonate 8-phosphate phosphatase (KDO 8-P phosphatase)
MPRATAKSRKSKKLKLERSSRPSSPDTALRRVKLFLCDVDGVLTDGSVWMGDGAEFKRFNIRDGLGLRMLQRQGIQVGWISRRTSNATRKRAEDLKIDFLLQGDIDKVGAVESILRRTGLSWRQVCFVGDDVVDLGALKRAGVAVAVADAISEVKAAADWVTKARGGRGAVRETVERVLKAQYKWQCVLREYAD